MTADDAMQALRTAIRAELLAELQAELAELRLVPQEDEEAEVYRGHYLDGFADAVLTLERA